MQKKNMWIIIIIVVVVLAIGGYAVFHKSSKTSTSSTSTSSASSTPAKSAEVVQTKTNSSTGSYLADSSGNALYTYSQDTAGVSNCTGSCLTAWPIYAVTTSSAALPANVTIITRSDGSKQYAYKGLPLYTFTGDSGGQVTGDGVSGFIIAKP